MVGQLLESHPHLRITVVDINPAMAMAQQHLRRFGDRAATLTADVSALPYPEQSFDLVLSWLTHLTITWEHTLAEARRVLRPGGTLVSHDLLDTVSARLHPSHRPIRALPVRQRRTHSEAADRVRHSTRQARQDRRSRCRFVTLGRVDPRLGPTDQRAVAVWHDSSSPGRGQDLNCTRELPGPLGQ